MAPEAQLLALHGADPRARAELFTLTRGELYHFFAALRPDLPPSAWFDGIDRTWRSFDLDPPPTGLSARVALLRRAFEKAAETAVAPPRRSRFSLTQLLTRLTRAAVPHTVQEQARQRLSLADRALLHLARVHDLSDGDRAFIIGEAEAAIPRHAERSVDEYTAHAQTEATALLDTRLAQALLMKLEVAFPGGAVRRRLADRLTDPVVAAYLLDERRGRDAGRISRTVLTTLQAVTATSKSTPDSATRRDPLTMVSYNHLDQAQASALAGQLRDRGVRVWIDLDEVDGRSAVVAQLGKILSTATVVLFVIGGAELGHWQSLEIGAAIERSKFHEQELLVVLLVEPGQVPPTATLLLALKYFPPTWRANFERIFESIRLAWTN